ncbi:MAG: geranylgeranyl reductase, partial [Bacteroidota bacterium]
AATILRRIDPTIIQHFEAQAHLQTDVWGIRFVAPNNRVIDVPFKLNYDKASDPKQGYVSKRLDFDHLLIEAVKKRSNITFHEGISIEQIEKIPGGFRLYDKSKNFQLETSLLIVANGANSQFSRHYAGLEKDEKHHAGAVRAYFRNVGGIHPDNFIELH